MRVTTWTEYSLIISIHLARRGNGQPVAARDISDSERLPGDYVEQILLRLRRAGLVESVRGARGGYFLARDPAKISVHDVMTACDHQTFEINCDTHQVDRERCGPGAQCSIRPVWQALRFRVDELLKGVTLADLMQDEVKVQEIVGIGAAT
ncbi:MAG TPA: Rrf2 family transcriptional regulator [Gemmatimonadales bacterium]|jgi:Rrf2 family transcriptional regulator, iron-sulfur cluster assembly transcription factor|nr:Rrf2 family transcriptional regulator [Gemmatimonadales bacterium]